MDPADGHDWERAEGNALAARWRCRNCLCTCRTSGSVVPRPGRLVVPEWDERGSLASAGGEPERMTCLQVILSGMHET